MFKLDLRGIQDLEDDLRQFRERAYPFATKQTLNQTAFEAMTIARNIVDRKMVLRNQWTKGSIQYEQTRTLNVAHQESIVGSIQEYMATQETGGSESSKGVHGMAIPTGYSAGQEGQKPRTRLPKRANMMRAIKLAQRIRGRTPKQRMRIAIRNAVNTKRRYIFLKGLAHKKAGIFRVIGGRKGARDDGPTKGATIKMVHDLSQRTVRVPRNPWLMPAVNIAMEGMDDTYRKALIFQLKRWRIFE